jgi:hypothetical protein
MPPQHTPFGSEYVAWRETKSDVYCKQDDSSLLNLLRWNDISMANSLQWWTPLPHGFGAVMDVRSGSQWIIIATATEPCDDDMFEYPTYYLPSFRRSQAENNLALEVEAILLTQGMRMFVSKSIMYHTTNARV